MVNVALYIRLQAKPGKEAEVEDFLKNALTLAREETSTAAWFALRMGQSTFGIFDAFPDEQGRQAHLTGHIAAALKAKATELLAEPLLIQQVDVLAAKLPGTGFQRLKQKVAASKLTAALGLAGLAALGWFAARYLRPRTPYEAFQHEPATAPL